MKRPPLRLLVWAGTAALIVLSARAIAYALRPGPTANLLEQSGGGAALPVVALVALSFGASLAVAICWLVALGIRERALLERRHAPRFRPGRTAALALMLFVASSLGGGLFEAYIHWRAGLGWHGLHCISGPFHQNLLPIDGALSIVAAALLAAADHVITWMRRTVASLLAPVPRFLIRLAPSSLASLDVPQLCLRITAGGPRAPPALS